MHVARFRAVRRLRIAANLAAVLEGDWREKTVFSVDTKKTRRAHLYF